MLTTLVICKCLLLLALCEHGVCVSSLQDTHTDGYAPVPVRHYELTRLREMCEHGVLLYFMSDCGPSVSTRSLFGPPFSGPAFSSPVKWSLNFRTCIFGPAFSCLAIYGPAFSVDPCLNDLYRHTGRRAG